MAVKRWAQVVGLCCAFLLAGVFARGLHWGLRGFLMGWGAADLYSLTAPMLHAGWRDRKYLGSLAGRLWRARWR